MKKAEQKVLESAIQRTITEWLALNRIFFYRQNTGAFRTPNGALYRFGAVGSPDIVCVVAGRYVGIEVKAEKGKQTDAQKLFEMALEKAGGTYILAQGSGAIQTVSNRIKEIYKGLR